VTHTFLEFQKSVCHLNFFKGCHYRSEWLYNILDLFKRGAGYNARFHIAARHVVAGDAVLDVCSGTGRFREFISPACHYTAVDASPEFCRALEKKNVSRIICDLHQGIPADVPGCDVIVMIISLVQFRKTSAGRLLEDFKKIAGRVVIVEEILPCPRPEHSWFQKVVNYLCATDYYVPVAWYTRQDFEELMRRHGYRCERIGEHYMVGCYEALS
jgi:hypothetical protein